MSFVTYATRDGSTWTPEYLMSIDHELCIGCGRCFKVCTMGVLKLQGVDEDGNFCDPFDDDDGEVERKVMTIEKPGSCIGCASCMTVCGTKAQKHAPLAA